MTQRLDTLPRARPPQPSVRAAGGVTAVCTTALLLAGCSSLDGLFGGSKVDYRSQAAKTAPLEVPPDLTQLAREGRPGGIIDLAVNDWQGRAGADGTAVQNITPN